MELFNLEVLNHQKIATNTYKLVVKRPNNIIIKQGEFAMLKVEGVYLKRPLSISSFSEDSVSFIYKVLGHGTKILSESDIKTIEILLPLGNSFNINDTKHATIIAGGIGIAPMHGLCSALSERSIEIDVHLGYKTKDEIFLAKELSEFANVHVYTEDGSAGINGYCIPDTIKKDSHIFACGPNAMLKAIANNFENEGQLSTEEYMACGFGICSGCAIKLKSGVKKVCSDGPVFNIEEFRC